jgi:predicted ATPase
MTTEAPTPKATASTEERELLRDLLGVLLTGDEFPELMPFRRRPVDQRALLDDLEERGLMRQEGSRLVLTPAGLVACESDEARQLIEVRNELIPCLRDAYRQSPGRYWAIDELTAATKLGVADVSRALTFLGYEPGPPVTWEYPSDDPIPDEVLHIKLHDGVNNLVPLAAEAEEPIAVPGTPAGSPRLAALEITGYRPFAGFSAALGDLTVIIGANAAGKSSLFDFLRFISHAAQAPIPPEIDPRAVGKLIFHVGGDERLSFALVTEGAPPLRYEAEIVGPVGSARVARERLSVVAAEGAAPIVLLDLQNGKGTVRDLSNGASSWSVPPNELALRRALDPRLATISGLQGFLASWRFYGGFDTSANAGVRRPVHTESEPILAEDGANLSAVLNWLFLRHADAREDLELRLRGSVPGFQALGLKPAGKGMVIGTWREEGLAEELTFADLSDGTLRLLCWLALLSSPDLPSLICIDEPEVGLHPRVLPTLAGALEMAAAHAQILVATHSPHFLAQFKLDEIAVMRKESGRAVMVRPATSAALRREVEEIGGEAIARLFLSEELEVLPRYREKPTTSTRSTRCGSSGEPVSTR